MEKENLKLIKGQKPAAAFYRISSASQDQYSLPAQLKLGQEYADKKGLQVVKKWSEIESASKEADRKHFFEMVEYVKEHEIRDIIFDKVDRAVRGFKSAVIVEELVESHGVRFHFTRENLIIDSDSPPQEKLRFYLSTILGKYYIDNLKVEINKGVTARLEDGHWCWKAPVGYLNYRDPKTKQSIVVVDPTVGPAISEIFQFYSKGNAPWTDLIKILERATGKTHDFRVVGHILKNPFYYGGMVVKGKRLEQMGKHEPLIDKETWDKCQKIRGIRAQQYQSNPRGRLEIKPFMGLIRCGCCNHTITGEAKTRANGKVYIYYRCANRKCSDKRDYISQEDIHAQLIAAFKPFERFTPVATKIFVEETWKRLDDLDTYTTEEVDKIQEKRKELKADIKRFHDLLAQGVVTKDEYEAFKRIKDEALDDFENEIKAYTAADRETYKKGLSIIELFTNIPKIMSLKQNLMVKARLAEIVLSNISLKSGKLSYTYARPFDDLLKVTTCNGWWGHPHCTRTL